MGGTFSGLFSVNEEINKTETTKDSIDEIQKLKKLKKLKKKKNNLLTPILQRPTN